MKENTPAIGIIGGSGLYQMEQLRNATEQRIETPFGSPSDALIGGNISGRQVYFLPRHGRGHRILPHVSFAEPISLQLRNLLAEAAKKVGVTVHNGGTYVNMDGPAFSTRAESELNRRNGFDVIGMTNLPEAKLAREAEIALATMAMITDYDCWKVEEEPVSAQTVFGHLTANAEAAKRVLVEAIPRIPVEPDWAEHRSLDNALVTERKLWPKGTVEKLTA